MKDGIISLKYRLNVTRHNKMVRTRSINRKPKNAARHKENQQQEHICL